MPVIILSQFVVMRVTLSLAHDLSFFNQPFSTNRFYKLASEQADNHLKPRTSISNHNKHSGLSIVYLEKIQIYIS